MTQSKHTPAPWRISDNPRTPYLVYGSNDYAVADCKVYHNKTDINADMNLIAAAPELLEALEDILELAIREIASMECELELSPYGDMQIGDIDHAKYLTDKAEAAIAKAKGE